MSRSQANRSACTKRMRAWFRLAFCFARAMRLLVEVDADHLVGAAQRLGVDGEAAGVAAQVEHALARAERGQQPAVVALVEEEAGLVLAARRHAEAHAVLGDDLRRRRLRRPAIERLLLLDVLLGEPVEAARRDNAPPAPPGCAARKRYMPGGEELQHQRRAEAIDHQAAQAVALGMDQAVGVGDGVQAEPVAAQRDGPAQPAGEEGVVDGLGRVGRSARAGRCANGRCRSRGRPTGRRGRSCPRRCRGGRRAAGFSTIFWKIHGCDERRAIFSRTWGSVAGAAAVGGKT